MRRAGRIAMTVVITYYHTRIWSEDRTQRPTVFPGQDPVAHAGATKNDVAARKGDPRRHPPTARRRARLAGSVSTFAPRTGSALSSSPSEERC
jgi:hypothetical protein